jgi:hypothetical protein
MNKAILMYSAQYNKTLNSPTDKIEEDANSSENIIEQNGGDTEKQPYTLLGFEHAIPFLSNYFKTRSTLFSSFKKTFMST